VSSRQIPSWVLISVLLALLCIATAVGADLAVQEMGLNPNGTAYEINAASEGTLWISENGEQEIWALDPATSEYAVYSGAGQVSDARQAPDGSVWWIDGSDALGQLWPDTSAVTVWQIPGAATLSGTAIDASGDVWLSQFFDPQVYRFTASSGQVCTYTLGTIGGNDYILAQGDQIWLGDWNNDRIHRLDAASGQLTSWALPYNPFVNYYPEGLALDSAGNLWWADAEWGRLARLEPDLDRLTTYALPVGSTPEMVAVNAHRLWYTEDGTGTLGRLDPYLATGTSQTLFAETSALMPSCTTISPASTGTLSTSSDTAAWASATYTTTVDAGGWWVHELPQDAYPWGIAAAGGAVWVVDNGRQMLARVQDTLSVVACVEADADGDPATSGDQTPLEGWTAYLIADGVGQEPSQLIGPSGCVVWDGLGAGVSYGVEETVPAGWAPLDGATHTFGELVPGEANVHTFLNSEGVQVSACKLQDADGDPATTADRTPLEGWTLYLSVDGVRQEPGRLTGANGCATWSDLGAEDSYGVQEEDPADWTPLGPTQHSFGQVSAGEPATHTFINAESVQVSACKLQDEDGELATTGDLTPVEGWTLYLSVDGVRQQPGVATGADGCYAWTDLAPAHDYSVTEEVPSGWGALTPTSQDFLAAVPGESYAAQFVNVQELTYVYLPAVLRQY
jgi:streptogramin lyase